MVGAPTWNTGADEQRTSTAWDDLFEEIDGLDLGGELPRPPPAPPNSLPRPPPFEIEALTLSPPCRQARGDLRSR